MGSAACGLCCLWALSSLRKPVRARASVCGASIRVRRAVEAAPGAVDDDRFNLRRRWRGLDVGRYGHGGSMYLEPVQACASLCKPVQACASMCEALVRVRPGVAPTTGAVYDELSDWGRRWRRLENTIWSICPWGLNAPLESVQACVNLSEPVRACAERRSECIGTWQRRRVQFTTIVRTCHGAGGDSRSRLWSIWPRVVCASRVNARRPLHTSPSPPPLSPTPPSPPSPPPSPPWPPPSQPPT